MSDVALTNGRWVPRGAVLVWEPDQEPSPPAVEPKRGSVCPCGAAIDYALASYCSEQCRREARRTSWRTSKARTKARGTKMAPHRPRLAVRLTDEQRTRGYAQYRQGSRTDFAVTAYREYQRLKTRRYRARRAAA